MQPVCRCRRRLALCLRHLIWESIFMGRFHSRSLGFVVALLAFVATSLTGAQSVDKKAFAPLQQGANSGKVDSMIGPHYCYFYAEPGAFQVAFRQGSALGFAASGHATVVVS